MKGEIVPNKHGKPVVLRTDLFDWLDMTIMDRADWLMDHGDEEGGGLLRGIKDEILDRLLTTLLDEARLTRRELRRSYRSQ
jgi:hypothetical protein